MKRNVRIAALSVSLCGLLHACTESLPNPIGSVQAPAVNPDPPSGLVLGLDLSLPIDDVAIAGAAIPRVQGGFNDVMFVAFTTATSAQAADLDQGDPRDPDNPAEPRPNDANGLQDVFVAAVVRAADDGSGAFSLRLFDVFRHPRCFTCHGTNPAPPLASSHENHNKGANCTECHSPGDIGLPAGTEWTAPPAPAPGKVNFDFRNRNAEDLCTSVVGALDAGGSFDETREHVREHLLTDPFIVWAIDNGRVPNGQPTLDTVPVDLDGPGSWTEFVNDWVDRWDQGAATSTEVYNCFSAGSRKDVVLASRSLGGTSAGNAGTRRPALTWIPNSDFDPLVTNDLDGDGYLDEPAGQLFVAYESDSTNLVPGDTNGLTDVFRSTIEVWISPEFAVNGGPADGFVNLRFRTGSTVRVSQRDGAGVHLLGRATAPAIGPSGDRIAFLAEDGDLLAPSGGVADSNGFVDVFVREISTGRTRLVSQNALGLNGGNAASAGPVMSLGSDRAVAFESDASDLVPMDSNAVKDVFYVMLTDGPLELATPPERASVRTGGAEGSGGPSRSPSIHVIDADSNDVLIAFESSKTNLSAAMPPGSSRQVYLHESAFERTTLMNQKALPLRTIASAGSSPADSRHASISPDGQRLYFSSTAANIDAVRPADDNFAEDVFEVNLLTFLGDGRIRPARVSITAAGFSSDGASYGPRTSCFRGPGDPLAPDQPDFGRRSVVFETLATNLPRASAANPFVLVFSGQPGN